LVLDDYVRCVDVGDDVADACFAGCTNNAMVDFWVDSDGESNNEELLILEC
jgi:hypothetical protein